MMQVRDLTGADLARLRRERERGPSGWTAPPRETVERAPLPVFKPQKPDVVFRQMMDHLQGWSRASKEDWMTSIAVLRQHDGSAVAHMTDEQLYLMLRGKIEEALKVAYGKLGRGRELQIKTGGF